MRLPPLSNRAFVYTSLVAMVAAVVTRSWVAEDGYITFRVVENLYLGRGLVFNAGERVEAFTHPLWMMLLLIVRGSGAALHIGSIVAGWVFVFAAWVHLAFRKDKHGKWVYPLWALALAMLSGFRDFSTAGMEFSLVFLLLVLFLTALEDRRLSDSPFYHSLLLTLLYLTRPELALLVIYYSFHFLYELWMLRYKPDFVTHPASFFSQEAEVASRSDSLTVKEVFFKSFQWALPILLFAGGYHLFRFLYYGELFPNTYYAKSGTGSDYRTGFYYLAYTILWSYPLVLAALATASLILMVRRKGERLALYGGWRDGAIVILLVAYVVRLGGDFMAFRFLLPELTMAGILMHRFFRQRGDLIPDRWKPSISLLLLLAVALTAFIPLPYSRGYVANERVVFTGNQDWWTVLTGSDHPWALRGKAYRQLQQCLGYEKFSITNSQYQAKCLRGVGLGYFGYNAGPGVSIMDEQGLPDREVARAPVFMRFRPGHEHYITFSEALQKGVLFCSTGDAAYDRIMETPAGILISLDEELLSTIPDISSRLNGLWKLKKEGSPVIARLEKRYHTSLEIILSRPWVKHKNPLMKDQETCWNQFPGGRDDFFY